MFYSATNHWVELCDTNCHPSHHPCFFDVRQCKVFAHYNHKKYMSVTVKNICGILQSNDGKLEESEGYNGFFIASCVLESK